MTYSELKYNMNVIRKNKYFTNVHDYLPAVYISTLMANSFVIKHPIYILLSQECKRIDEYYF